jgi:hypothetical protein
VTAQEKLFTAQTEKRQKAYFAKKKKKKSKKKYVVYCFVVFGFRQLCVMYSSTLKDVSSL